MCVIKAGGLLGREKGTEEMGRDGVVRKSGTIRTECNDIYKNFTAKLILCAEQNNKNKKIK